MQVPPLRDEGVKELLKQPLVAKVATQASNGELRITPMWFGADGDTIVMNTWENTGAAKNLQHNPTCSVLVDTTDFPYKGVHFWGTAKVEGPENDVEGMGKLFAPYRGDVETATEYAKQLVGWGKRVYIRFTPERHTTWDFSQG